MLKTRNKGNRVEQRLQAARNKIKRWTNRQKDNPNALNAVRLLVENEALDSRSGERVSVYQDWLDKDNAQPGREDEFNAWLRNGQ